MVAYTRTTTTVVMGCIHVERSIYMYSARCFFRRGFICPGEPGGSRDYAYDHMRCKEWSSPNPDMTWKYE